MDFIIDLPPSKGYNTLMVIVDFFSKQAHFIPTKLPLTANDVAQVFFKYIFKYHGLAKRIMFDRDLRLAFGFWQELLWILGSKLCMLTSTHLETNGGLIRVSKIIFIVTLRQINQIRWSKSTCLSSATMQLST